jgi:hypothetical protein
VITIGNYNFQLSDHIFVLKSAVKKYTRKKNKLFTCFIDFRKAFDSVWHDALFLKLRQVGDSDLFYRIIYFILLELLTIYVFGREKVLNSFHRTLVYIRAVPSVLYCSTFLLVTFHNG